MSPSVAAIFYLSIFHSPGPEFHKAKTCSIKCPLGRASAVPEKRTFYDETGGLHFIHINLRGAGLGRAARSLNGKEEEKEGENERPV